MSQNTLRPGTSTSETPKAVFNLVAAGGNRLVTASTDPIVVRK